MLQTPLFVGWSQIVLVFTAVVGLWYFYGAVKSLLRGTTKHEDVLRSLGLGLAWLSVWAVYNPHDFAALVPYLVKAAFLVGCIAFIAGLGWSFVINFQLPWKRMPKHSESAQTTPVTQ